MSQAAAVRVPDTQANPVFQKPTSHSEITSLKGVLSCEMGNLLVALRRVQAPLNKDGANIALIAGSAKTARLVATSGPHLSCSTPLGMDLDVSLVIRGAALLKTLGTFPADDLEAALQLGLASAGDQDRFCDVQVRSKRSRYKGRFALVQDGLPMNREAIEREKACRAAGKMVQAPQKPFVAGLRRAIVSARNKSNNQDFSNVFFEASQGKLYVIGVSSTHASRFCVAEAAIENGIWSISAAGADVLLQGVLDQVVDADAPIEIAFAESQVLVGIGHVTFALRCTQGRLPNLDRILSPLASAWSVTLTRDCVKKLQQAMPVLAGDDTTMQGVRFQSDAEGLFAVADGKNVMDARVPLENANMSGEMPGSIIVSAAIFGAVLGIDTGAEYTTLEGAAPGGMEHIHVHVQGLDGLSILMPTRI